MNCQSTQIISARGKIKEYHEWGSNPRLLQRTDLKTVALDHSAIMAIRLVTYVSRKGENEMWRASAIQTKLLPVGFEPTPSNEEQNLSLPP